jgi:carbon monoxide dehydrogenase subunit G
MADMQFGGEELFAAGQQTVYDMLVDLDALGAGIPDVVSTEKVDDHTLRAVVRPGFSFLRGTMKLKIQLAELEPPNSALMRIDSQGIGVSMVVESRMRLEPATTADDRPATKLTWLADVSQMKGLVATISPGLVRAAADQVVRNGWKKLHERLAEQA